MPLGTGAPAVTGTAQWVRAGLPNLVTAGGGLMYCILELMGIGFPSTYCLLPPAPPPARKALGEDIKKR